MSWTPQQVELLKQLFETTEYEEIAARLNKTRGAVRNKCWRLGLRKKDAEWTKEEDDRLRLLYGEREGAPLNMRQVADEMGRSVWGVAMRASRLGLTDTHRPVSQDRRQRQAATLSETIKRRGHPRGMLGKRQSEKARKQAAENLRQFRENMPEAHRQALSDRMSKMMAGRAAKDSYSRARRGKRQDLGDIHFRSSWEANYARYLNFLKARNEIAEWEYEPETFWFEKIKRGVRSYKPDFRITMPDGGQYWVEVKGWMDNKSKTKLRRMKKYYPHVRIEVVDSKAYAELGRKLGAAIPGWEAA